MSGALYLSGRVAEVPLKKGFRSLMAVWRQLVVGLDTGFAAGFTAGFTSGFAAGLRASPAVCWTENARRVQNAANRLAENCILEGEFEL